MYFETKSLQKKGSINELTFGFGANYDEKLMIGLSLGVPFVSYRQEKIYREADEGTTGDGDVPFFESLTYRENLTTTGTGINAKLGLIYRVNQQIRLGAAVHSPTSIRLEDNFSTSMQYTFTDSGVTGTDSGESPDGTFDYRLRTPWRLMGSAGFIIQKFGFISGEVEWVDFRNSSFNYDGFEDAERDVNQSIEDGLSSVLNIRLGGEVAYQLWRFRAGVGLKQSPFSDDDAFDPVISAGLGVRLKGVLYRLSFSLR